MIGVESSHHGFPPDTMMVDIEQPHHHDVLCGRGVTTNRHPGNESFRSLVSLNKEIYVTSTKRQKMSISRSIVEAVRSLNPPGRFLEKNPCTGLWSDIGDRKAIEKTSQALRDGAAGLRKQLSADLGDPEFLNAVFDNDASKPLPSDSNSKPTTSSSSSSATAADVKPKEKVVKPVKAKPHKKGHRRTRSNPTIPTVTKSSIKKHKSVENSESPSEWNTSNSITFTPKRQPVSPLSPSSQPCSPSTGVGWTNQHSRYPQGNAYERTISGPFMSPGSPQIHIVRSRGFHDSPSTRGSPAYHGVARTDPFTLRPTGRNMQQRPPQWVHGPPRYPSGHFHHPASPSMVHPPQSPLPPGVHQFNARGYIQKPPLSPRKAPWSPHSFPAHSPHGPFRPRHEYRQGPHGNGPEWYSPMSVDSAVDRGAGMDHVPSSERYGNEYYYEGYPDSSLAVPVLNADRRKSPTASSFSFPVPRSTPPSMKAFHRPNSPHVAAHSRPPVSLPREFSPPISRSPRRVKTKVKVEDTVESANPDAINEYDGKRVENDGTPGAVKVSPCSKDEKSQSPIGIKIKREYQRDESPKIRLNGRSHHSNAKPTSPRLQDKEPAICYSSSQSGAKIKHDEVRPEDEDEKKVEDPRVDDDEYSLSPIPFEREDPVVSLLEVPEDILKLPISPCGPHD